MEPHWSSTKSVERMTMLRYLNNTFLSTFIDTPKMETDMFTCLGYNYYTICTTRINTVCASTIYSNSPLFPSTYTITDISDKYIHIISESYSVKLKEEKHQENLKHVCIIIIIIFINHYYYYL